MVGGFLPLCIWYIILLIRGRNRYNSDKVAEVSYASKSCCKPGSDEAYTCP